MTYVLRDPAQVMTSLSFTDDIGLCGSFTYSLSNIGGTPYDWSIFTLNTVTPTIQIYSTNPVHITTFNLVLTGTLGPWGSASVTVTFIVLPSCYDSLITVD